MLRIRLDIIALAMMSIKLDLSSATRQIFIKKWTFSTLNYRSFLLLELVLFFKKQINKIPVNLCKDLLYMEGRHCLYIQLRVFQKCLILP